MELDSKLFLHPSDKAAMSALKAIPGFSQVMKVFMKIWSEQQFCIINLSTNLKLGNGQLDKYYDMLIPICQKLGIEVPDLYVELDVNPNAYTYGDTNPFIVLTSGLFETIPDELIPTVLAHECGHIACHHTLYTTMGRAILNGAANFVNGLGNIALYPIQLAFAYWMRCSEFSADRAAIICDGSADNTIEMCMRFAGYDKDIMADGNVELFMEQAREYRELVNDSAWNKTLEFVLFQSYSHPLNAVRAYEAREWGLSERCANIVAYVNAPESQAIDKLPIELPLKKYVGNNYEDIIAKLMSMGFTNVKTIRNTENTKSKNGDVISITVNGSQEDDLYQKDAAVEIEYFEPKTEEEIALEHPNEIKLPENAKYYHGKDAEEVQKMFMDIGFTNIIVKEMAMSKLSIGEKENCVAQVMIDGNKKFGKDDWYKPEVEVLIYYYVKL